MLKRIITSALLALACLIPLKASAVIQQPWQGEKAVGILEAWNGESTVPDSVVLVVPDSSGGAYLLLCRNNPMQGVDPLGLWLEDLVLGVPSLALGGVSLWQNIREGNIAGSFVDVVGIVADTAAIALPGVPGGVGYSIKAARAVRTLNRADTALNVVLATANAYEASQEDDQLGVAVNSGQAALQMGSSALGLRKARRLTEALSDNAGDATKVVGKLDGVSGRFSKVADASNIRSHGSQRQLDVFLDQPRFKNVPGKPVYDPDLTDFGMTEGMKISVGSKSFYSTDELVDTIFHEKLHTKITRRITEGNAPLEYLRARAYGRAFEEEYVGHVMYRYWRRSGGSYANAARQRWLRTLKNLPEN